MSVRVFYLGMAVVLAGCGNSVLPVAAPSNLVSLPKAVCGAGSNPETGMQGRVPKADYDSGRAAKGYTCNTTMISNFPTANPTGTVGGFKVERYIDKAGHDCAYYDTTLLYPTNAGDGQSGVNVMDMSDPANPRMTARLVTGAMQSPHESLVLSKEAGVLAAVLGNASFGPGVVDVYSLEPDCRNPQVRASAPVGTLGHESGLSLDGKTFYSASPGTPTLTAVDISNPSLPVPLWRGDFMSHGLSVSNDGNRIYIAGGDGAGVRILDVSEIQARKANPQVKVISSLSWPNKTIPQNAIPFTRNGRAYLVEIDEYSSNSSGGSGASSVASNGAIVGAGRIIDIQDETKPFVVSDLRLEVHDPKNRAAIAGDPGANLPVQGYAGHYCNIPSRINPDIVACSMIASGLRIFDIRNPAQPREIAYFIPPIKPRVTPGFDASAWAMSSPSFVPERKEIWYSDGYGGLYVVRVTNGVW